MRSVLWNKSNGHYSETVGVCLSNDLPSCFSERERLFIVENMVQDFREIFIAIVVGVTLTLLLLGLTTVYMVKAGRCCGKRREENLKQADLER